MIGDDTTIATDGPRPTSSRRNLLVVGDAHLQMHPLDDGTSLVIGRDASCEVSLVDAKISRKHACIHAGPPTVLEDLGSTNGVHLDGRRLEAGERVELRRGQSVQIGPFVATLLETPKDARPDAPAFAAIPILDPTPRGVSDLVGRVARGAVSVLITGETGTGKEVLARTLHELSGRKGIFVAINCATLTEQLLESELFGYERGAFTGATGAKPGLFELASGGTVLLDEIGDLPLGLQAKLLRVLETREVYRLGGVKPVTLDARFLAATHHDLTQDIGEGGFRRDLYFRLNGITFTLTPLRSRRDAIRGLAIDLLDEAARAAGRPRPRLDEKALRALGGHDWPGNVRELRTVLERALLLARGDEIGVADILFDRVPAEPSPPDDGETRLAAAAAAHRGNVTAIARALGTSRSQVRRLAERYGIDLDRYR